jgi:hypothetical protein
LAILDFWVEESIGLQNVVEYLRFDNMPQIVETSLYIHRDELSDTLLEDLHLIVLTFVFKQIDVGCGAADFVPKGVVVALIVIYSQKFFPNVNSLLSEPLRIYLVDQSLLQNLLLERFIAIFV